MIAVLLMAYGSPGSAEEIEPYLKDIRRGRDPSPDAVKELTERYETIGWSPLLEMTTRQAEALEKVLNDRGTETSRTYIGMKHWHPFISATVEQIVDDEPDEIVGLALAPHYSRMSIGGYESRLREALDHLGSETPLRMIHQWYDEPAFVDFAAANLRDTLANWDARVFFTAHSLPARILEEGDPYRDQLMESSQLVADAASVIDWEFAFQSAGHTGEPWLGPDILDRLEAFAQQGGRHAVIAPIGFVADHLEILYDVDVECVEKAKELNLDLRRTPSPNDDPRFIATLADTVLQTE